MKQCQLALCKEVDIPPQTSDEQRKRVVMQALTQIGIARHNILAAEEMFGGFAKFQANIYKE